ncbi:hypothetical protein BANE1_62 [Mycobacterium phage Bane1]|uniref:Uncharacterized protein n=2 Tax=Coopervirus bane1 TaxID=1983109 RepID=T2A9X6_9CAUD|nr:hypothetical protein BANE1_62 [Mycobacterium phage Bane1]AGU92100.1 hypothetical protein BANE1_62 [Mycobacterium phage Bane1]AGU92209.1 hypothetical protein BANE2_62 [Mycobacterium phage Bane2]
MKRMFLLCGLSALQSVLFIHPRDDHFLVSHVPRGTHGLEPSALVRQHFHGHQQLVWPLRATRPTRFYAYHGYMYNP